MYIFRLSEYSGVNVDKVRSFKVAETFDNFFIEFMYNDQEGLRWEFDTEEECRSELANVIKQLKQYNK